jgi:hypothetical protein
MEIWEQLRKCTVRDLETAKYTMVSFGFQLTQPYNLPIVMVFYLTGAAVSLATIIAPSFSHMVD